MVNFPFEAHRITDPNNGMRMLQRMAMSKDVMRQDDHPQKEQMQTIEIQVLMYA